MNTGKGHGGLSTKDEHFLGYLKNKVILRQEKEGRGKRMQVQRPGGV